MRWWAPVALVNLDTLVAAFAANAYLLCKMRERSYGLGKLQAIPAATWSSHGYAGAFRGKSRTSRRF
ncbi:hypothetical protein BU25DRAFT_409067 [Macroventuria anomochaeta]|uniref:Uncharacterized protein n=1 Tax=Macroventuria anomochaeta TaxID=301207 RepID=A0ACB6S6I3_9PLEO|nr:uncharacterized protein BU25DRAFT_409067 [Macroventuria anomochaeta]KAF2629806.1 hypothetical protein BU25DRAFT_409067 [Macroventuria anomochaeta]